MSSMKSRRPSMRASSGTDQKRKLKKTRSIKLASSGMSRPSSTEDNVEYDQPSIVPSSEADKSPEHSKVQCQGSHHNSESSFTSNNQCRKDPKMAKSDSSASLLKSSRTLRRHRILTKTVSLKSKRPSMKCTEVSEISDSSVDRATCSSTLKDSKFPQRSELQTEGSESGGNLAVKVCPYTYCSLHGHRHGTSPPLKRFVSMQRRLIKPQKSTKPEICSVAKAKHYSNGRKGIHSSVTAKANEGDSTDAAVYHIVKEDTVAGSNLEILEDDSESNMGVLEASATAARVNLDEKDEDSEPDSCFSEGVSSSVDSASNYISDESHKTQTKGQKFSGFWGLIYQHMVSGIATDIETKLSLDGKCKEEQDEGNHTLPPNKNPVSHQSASGKDQEMVMRDQDAGDCKFELWQSDAVKLVQEAFDKILSEIPDQSSDDQSISNDVTSEEDFMQKQAESGDQNSSSSFNGTKEGVAHDPEETQLQVININASEEDEVASQSGNKSNQKISKNWSNLKKIITLKRFVSALEKVRNYNPGKPRFLDEEPDPQTEKVHLRHRTVEERKNADEWMLDYALRQVISTLAPAQKRKVTLLVQAFEMVSPLPEIKAHLSSIPTASSNLTPVQGHNNSLSPRDEKNTSRFLSKASYPEMSFKETLYQVSNSPTAEQLIPGTSSELKGESLRCGYSNKEVGTPVSKTALLYLEEGETAASNLDNSDNNSIIKDNQPVINSSPQKFEELTSSDKHSPKLDDTEGTLHEKLVNGKILQEDNDSEIHSHNTKFNNEREETVNEVNAADLQSCQPKNSNPEDCEETEVVNRVTSSTSSSELLEETTTASGGEDDPRYKTHPDSSPDGPEPNETIDMVQEAKKEKQKYMRLWHIIYKHMVSGSGDGGTQSLLEDADNERNGDAHTVLRGQDADSSKNFSETNQEIVVDNQNESSQKIEYNRIQAIKLIEKAIDEIHLPDIQDDSSDDQSITGSGNPEIEIPRKNVEDGEAFISTYADSTGDTLRESNNKKLEHRPILDPETKLNPRDIRAPEESETVSQLGNNSKTQTQKSWSNLKKLILLKKFIKALENARKFNPHEPLYLPSDANSEAEKVHLRHQNTEVRKNAEEWMLDYELQQVVTKLTPARKRKVKLLVEAFETVTPTLEVKNHQRHDAAAYPHANLIVA